MEEHMATNEVLVDKEHHKFSERISVLESLQTQTTQIAIDTNRSVVALRSGIESLSNKMADIGKPQWSALATWAGVIVLFISMVGGSVIGNIISNQDRLENFVIKHADYILLTAEKDGRQSEKLSSLEQSIILLNTKHEKDADITREAHSQLINVIAKDIEKAALDLDNRMQRELDDNTNPINQRLDAIEERFYQHMLNIGRE